jgi:hypothetical protein
VKVPQTARVRWKNAYRIINSRYPPIDVFERVADPADWDSLFALEALTNPRIRQEWGEISVVPLAERVTGAGASWVMAAFTHLGKASRFTDGSYGVYYAAASLETAVYETTYHFGRFLAQTREPAGTLMDMRTLVSQKLDERFHDVRSSFPSLHQESYDTPQRFGAKLRAAGSNGIVYKSVRHPPSGECLAVFRPRAIPIPIQGAALQYHFDGTRIDRWFQLGGPDAWSTL